MILLQALAATPTTGSELIEELRSKNKKLEVSQICLVEQLDSRMNCRLSGEGCAINLPLQ